MNRIFLLSFSLFLGISTYAQDFITSDYDWNEDPLAITCPDSLKGETEVNLLRKRISEFGYSNDDFIERYIFHRVAYLGSDEAIEENNKIYLPLRNDETLELSKARAINPDGKIIELNEEDINTSEDEDGNLTYYYAFKGLVLGSIIEYVYIQVISPEYSGKRIAFQNEMPQLNVSFEIISPWNLVFSYVGSNGFGEMESDTTNEDINHLKIEWDYIPEYVREDQASYALNTMQVVYKLDENLYTGKKDIISYGSMADVIITNNTIGDKSETKIVSKWIKESAAKDQSDTEGKLRALEVYFKQSLAIIDVYSEDLKDLNFVAKNKVISPLGLTKAMALACNELGIEYEITMTCDRNNLKFDKKFEAYNYLDSYLLYFPEIDKYFDPSDNFTALGIISPYLQDGYGVFFQRVQLGDFVSGVSQIKLMKGTKAAESQHDMIMDVKMSDDFSSLVVDLESKSTGHFASAIQPYYDLMDPEDIEEANKSQVDWINENVDIHSVEAKNTGYANLGKETFIVSSSFDVSEYVVKARDKYLIKLGQLIGPQAEMYQETVRTKPVDTDFRKVYYREIKFEIPAGYKVTNEESININVDAIAVNETERYAGFNSSYTIENNTLTILCTEFYERVHYDVDEFEDYRAVINSAADFNKIVIYLEKE